MDDSSSEDEYNPLDFFDFSKPLKKVYQRPRRSQLEYAEELKNAEAFWDDRNRNAPAADSQYFVEFQKREKERMAVSLADHDKSINGAAGHVVPSLMSELESDTIGGLSTVHDQTIQRRSALENLRSKFNMDKSDGKRQQLPVFGCRNEILDKIAAYPVTIISGSTGCGKSTQVPQFILDSYARQDKYVNIICTQPRRLAAQAVAKRVCLERDWRLGGLVGYKVGLDKSNASRDTRLLYVTTGVLIKMLISNKSMAEWTHVVIDEVHERDKDMDFLLLIARRLITTNSLGVKLILMSATLNVEKLGGYFTWPMYPGGPPYCQAVSCKIPGMSNHPVAVFYLDDLVHIERSLKGPEETPALCQDCVSVCRTIIHEGIKPFDTDGAVLVFLPGEAEISSVMKELNKGETKLVIYPLHSRLPFEDAQKIFEPVKAGHRKVILSTNMAESSLTIPDVMFVIDFCLTKKLVADPVTNYSALQLVWADKNSCEQRKGRAGRVREGRVYRLIFKDFYERVLLNEHDPELKRAPLDKVILDVKLLDMGPPKEVLALALDPPNLRNIKTTILHLKDMGALLPIVTKKDPSTQKVTKEYDKEDGDLTVLGEIISSLPIDVRLGKLVVYGYLFNLLEESVIIAAGLSNKSIFTFPFEQKIKAYANKLMWSNRSFSDCLAVLLAYSVWKDKCQTGYFANKRVNEKIWCRERFLSFKTLREVELTVNEIKKSLERFQIREIVLPNRPDRLNFKASDNNYLMLKIAIFGAFHPNYFVRSHGNLDMHMVHKEINNRDPMTTLVLSGFPASQAKYGPLYTNQIKDLFSDFQPRKDLIDVEFDNSKIIVEFRRNMLRNQHGDTTIGDDGHMSMLFQKNLTLNITHHVYVAMKLKSMQHEQKMVVKLYSEEQAEKLWQKHRDTLKRLAESDQCKEMTMAESIGQVEPPDPDTLEVKFNVTHVNHPNSFWVVYHDDIHDRMMEDVGDAIDVWIKYASAENIPGPRHIKDLVHGNVYLAPFEQGYYRARIDSVDFQSAIATVFFIDFGNIEDVVMEDLIFITKEGLTKLGQPVMALIKTPALAMECSLANTKPNPIRSGISEWDAEAIKAFSNLLRSDSEDVTVLAEIYSVTPGPLTPFITVNLYKHSRVDTKSINDQLKATSDKKGLLAEQRNESYLTNENHKSRKGTVMYNPDRKRKMEERQRNYYGFSAKSFPDFVEPEAGKTKSQVYLKGPYHPLEYSLHSATQMGSQKMVRVEPESVNSVLLDDQPEDHIDQWLVAAHIGLNRSGSALQVRGTTLMPNKLGLGALLTMVFAPKVEMRVDKTLKRYTGCVAGLGHFDKDPNPSKMQPYSYSGPGLPSYNRDHDMEVRFDAIIDNEDLKQINQIRFHINSALTRDVRKSQTTLRISADNKMIEYQDKILGAMNALLNRCRKTKAKEMFKEDFKWGQLTARNYPKAKFSQVSFPDENDQILKVITGVELVQDDLDRADEIVTELKRLKLFANSMHSMGDVVNCPICPGLEQFVSPSDAKAHIGCQSHKENIADMLAQVRPKHT